MSLIARHLEANGIPTVILGSALDIVEHCGVPRFVYTGFPLGNPCGEPFNDAIQRQVVAAGIDLLESAVGPRTTTHIAMNWADDQWRDRYMEVRPEQRAELAKRGAERRAHRGQLKTDRKTRDG